MVSGNNLEDMTEPEVPFEDNSAARALETNRRIVKLGRQRAELLEIKLAVIANTITNTNYSKQPTSEGFFSKCAATVRHVVDYLTGATGNYR